MNQGLMIETMPTHMEAREALGQLKRLANRNELFKEGLPQAVARHEEMQPWGLTERGEILVSILVRFSGDKVCPISPLAMGHFMEDVERLLPPNEKCELNPDLVG